MEKNWAGLRSIMEVGSKGEGGMIADSQVSGVGNCRRRWQSLRDGGGRANSE